MILNRKNSKNDSNQEHVINEVIKALKNLIVVVDKENQSLRMGKVSAIKNIIEEKVAALQDFTNSQNIIENFLRQGGTFNQESSLIKKLQNLFAELSVVNRENDVLIRSNLEVSNILVEMYKENKTGEIIRQFGYNKDGKVSVAANVAHVMPSIGLNNKV
ncbi:MAG: hypothetical protein EKK63_03015 [Acinetobacter sp.]|uniref:flagellar export chaperone FlgN n=1 Tax=Acinetobacter sp. TaxID=472 RepID=UPI000F90AB85|nr:flagellar export chaperone FlgN [Acinetobacter sp.]RUP42026.1 MAG: hypothetical protein EKK63_03015 [Acinetobacter sp.]